MLATKIRKGTPTKQSTLTDYYAKNKNSHSQKENNIKKINDKFYEDCFRKMEKCTNSNCQREEIELRKQLKEIKEKIEKVEEAIASCRSVIDEKNILIESIRKKSEIPNETLKLTKIFEQFLNQPFSRDQIDRLYTFQSNSRSDSSFVLFVLKCLYADNLSAVEKKSSCGKSGKKGEKKEMMTPTKKKTLVDVYGARLRSYAKPEEFTSREKKLNKLIKDGFANITKSIKVKEIVTLE